jgi:serine/threonine protein kinase
MVESKEAAPNEMFAESNKGEIKKTYHFESKLANGAFGQVYLAKHRETEQQFAIKVIQKRRVKDYKTFINEINILKKLKHPNIIELHEIWEWSECCFLVLEYCTGGELFHYITEKKHLSEREASIIMKQLLEALNYLHQNKISHRDIKPENFMLCAKGDPTSIKMIDFGLSKDFSEQDFMMTMSGSPYYIAPEVFM